MKLFTIKTFKTIAALGTMVFFMSCTNDIIDTTGGLISNDNIEKDTISINPVLTTVAIDSVISNFSSAYMLGEYDDSKFGLMKNSIVSRIVPNQILSVKPLQRTTSDTPASVTTSSVSVVLELPLTFTSDLKIDGLVGEETSVFDIKVSTFTTYLEQYNQDGEYRFYYSNGANNGTNSRISLGTETVIGTKTDFGLKDTYTGDEVLSIDLDAVYFKTEFLDKLDAAPISTDDAFRDFFKGLKIEASKTSGDGFILPLDLTKANLKITYTNKVGDDDPTAQEMNFTFDEVTYGLYEHDHSNAAKADRVYVQGAGGYEVSVDMASLVSNYGVDSQSENWLINQAKLRIYIDQEDEDVTKNNNMLLNNFYIYGVKADDSLVVLEDYLSVLVVDGVYSPDNNSYVQFYITDFVKSYLKDVDKIKELRIKSRFATEQTSISKGLTEPAGAVFISDLTSGKAPELEVIYSIVE